jgi:molybdate transport system substrate-binding protein
MRIFWLAFAATMALGSVARADEIRVLSPGVGTSGGLREIAAAFAKKTGTKVTIVPGEMDKIAEAFKTATPAADLVILPMDLMGSVALDRGIKPGSFTPVGRVEIGLFKKESAPRPDISTVEKLAVVLKGASAIMYTNPASGSMQASMSDQLLKRPEFAGAKGLPVQGNAEPALRRGDGDAAALGLGLIQSPYLRGQVPGNPLLVGPLPPELGEHMDLAAAISARSTDLKDAQAFLAFLTSPEAAPLWAAKGTGLF